MTTLRTWPETWPERLKVMQEQGIDVQRACFHEAAHTIVLIYLKAKIEFVTVDPVRVMQDRTWPNMAGAGIVWFYRTALFYEMVAAFASVAWEVQWNGRIFTKKDFGSDGRFIQAAATALTIDRFPGYWSGSTEWNRYRFGLILDARRSARDLIRVPGVREKIVLLGLALEKKGNLSGEQIKAILA